MPPRKKPNPNDAAPDLSELLAPDEDLIAHTDDEGEVSEEEAAEIEALQAQLAQPAPEPKPEKFVPYEELSPAQKKIRDLRDQVTRRETQLAEQAAVEYDTTAGDTIVIHVLEDGFNAQGQSWYRGQELHFPIDGEAYKQTLNRNGVSWLEMRYDIEKQYERFGRQMFADGPWRGRKWGDIGTSSDPVEIAQMQRAAAAEARRAGSVPIIR